MFADRKPADFRSVEISGQTNDFLQESDDIMIRRPTSERCGSGADGSTSVSCLWRTLSFVAVESTDKLLVQNNG